MTEHDINKACQAASLDINKIEECPVLETMLTRTQTWYIIDTRDSNWRFRAPLSSEYDRCLSTRFKLFRPKAVALSEKDENTIWSTLPKSLQLAVISHPTSQFTRKILAEFLHQAVPEDAVTDKDLIDFINGKAGKAAKKSTAALAIPIKITYAVTQTGRCDVTKLCYREATVRVPKTVLIGPASALQSFIHCNCPLNAEMDEDNSEFDYDDHDFSDSETHIRRSSIFLRGREMETLVEQLRAEEAARGNRTV